MAKRLCSVLVFRPDGHGDFTALRTKEGAGRAAFVAFDLLSVDGKDFRKLPLGCGAPSLRV
jgi:ATP-dependent DNA ligase